MLGDQLHVVVGVILQIELGVSHGRVGYHRDVSHFRSRSQSVDAVWTTVCAIALVVEEKCCEMTKYLFADVIYVVTALGQDQFVSGLSRKNGRFGSPIRSYESTHTLSISARALGKEWENDGMRSVHTILEASLVCIPQLTDQISLKIC